MIVWPLCVDVAVPCCESVDWSLSLSVLHASNTAWYTITEQENKSNDKGEKKKEKKKE